MSSGFLNLKYQPGTLARTATRAKKSHAIMTKDLGVFDVASRLSGLIVFCFKEKRTAPPCDSVYVQGTWRCFVIKRASFFVRDKEVSYAQHHSFLISTIKPSSYLISKLAPTFSALALMLPSPKPDFLINEGSTTPLSCTLR